MPQQNDILFDLFESSGFQKNPAGQYLVNLKGPVLYLVGPYTISGQVLVLPIQGVGKSNITLGEFWATPSTRRTEMTWSQLLFSVNPDISITYDGVSVNRNGKEYLGMRNFKLTFTVSRYNLNHSDFRPTELMILKGNSRTRSPIQDSLWLRKSVQWQQGTWRQHQLILERKLEGYFRWNQGQHFQSILVDRRGHRAQCVPQGAVPGSLRLIERGADGSITN